MKAILTFLVIAVAVAGIIGLMTFQTKEIQRIVIGTEKSAGETDKTMKDVHRASEVPSSPNSKTDINVVFGRDIVGMPKFCADQKISISTCDSNQITLKNGKIYDVGQIGKQCWFLDDLEKKESSDFNPSKYFFYNRKKTKKGDSRNITFCPNGWRLPTDCDFVSLEMELSRKYALNAGLNTISNERFPWSYNGAILKNGEYYGEHWLKIIMTSEGPDRLFTRGDPVISDRSNLCESDPQGCSIICIKG